MDASQNEYSSYIVAKHIELEKICLLMYKKEITEEEGLKMLTEVQDRWGDGAKSAAVVVFAENDAQAATFYNYVWQSLDQFLQLRPDEEKGYFEVPKSILPHAGTRTFLFQSKEEPEQELPDWAKE